MAIIHVTRSGTNLGTFSEEEVRSGLQSGRFVGSDLGWREGMGTWQPLSQFAEFAETAPPSTAAPTGEAPAGASVPEVSATPAISGAAVLPGRNGLPWDQRHAKGFF